jgi:cytidylate kinase
MSGREPVVTVDGPAGAGKTTAARELARRLGFRLLDTGAMYRAVALSLARAGIDVDDEVALARHLAQLRLEVDGGRVRVNGRDVTEEIRTEAVGALTSRLTALHAVRDAVTPLQRRLASAGGIVLEGRDTGSVVWPQAEVKFYLDASLAERARRRHAELARAGAGVSLDEVQRELEERDARDRSRTVAPLVTPAQATVIDTTALTPDAVVARMLEAIEGRRCCTRS